MTRQRISRTTKTLADGTKVVRTKLVEAPVLEWVCQAEQVRQLRLMPEYASTIEDVHSGKGKFTLAADQNAARRGKQASVQAKAAGMMAGEHDVRIYMAGGFLGLIENKVGKAALQDSQKLRHPLLDALGFRRQVVIRATSPDEMARLGVEQVKAWLAELPSAANDNDGRKAA